MHPRLIGTPHANVSTRLRGVRAIAEQQENSSQRLFYEQSRYSSSPGRDHSRRVGCSHSHNHSSQRPAGGSTAACPSGSSARCQSECESAAEAGGAAERSLCRWHWAQGLPFSWRPETLIVELMGSSDLPILFNSRARSRSCTALDGRELRLALFSRTTAENDRSSHDDSLGGQ